MKKPRLWLLLAAALLAGAAFADGPFGGTVVQIAQDREGKLRYAATSRGLFRMGSDGWERLEALGVAQLTAVAQDGDTLLVATRSKGVLRSEDSGATWTQAGEGLKSSFGAPVDEVNTIIHDPASRRFYLGSAGKGLFQSSDAGRSWAPVGSWREKIGPAAQHVTAILPATGERPLTIGTDGEGVLALREGGWEKVGQGLPKSLRVSGMAQDPENPSRVVLGTVFDGVWESRDAGATFSQLHKGQFGVVGAVEIGAEGAVAAFLGQEGFLLLRQNAPSRPIPMGYAVIRDIVPAPGGGYHLAAVNDGILNVDREGKLTGETNQGLEATTIRAISPEQGGKVLWVGDANGVFVSADAGATWVHRDKGLITGDCSAFLRVGKELFLGTGGQGVYLWSEEKGEWLFRGRALGTSNTIHSMVSSADGRIWVGTEGGVLWTSDGGLDWKRTGPGIALTARTTVAADPADASHLYAANTKALYETLDGGENWREIAKGDYVDAAMVDGELWTRGLKKLMRWRKGEAVEVFDAGQSYLQTFAPTAEGVWVGTDEGLWSVTGKQIKLQWPEAGVTALRIEGGDLLVGTDGRGLKIFKIE